MVTGGIAVVLSAAMAVLFLPGMPAALTPPEWVIVGLWGVFGIVLMLRIPSVSGGPDAEQRLLAATHPAGGEQGAHQPPAEIFRHDHTAGEGRPQPEERAGR